jgi:hypothetical protein
MEPSDYSTQLQYYSNLGINCIRGWDLGDPTGPPDESPPIQYYFANAKNSVSSFNPNGLMVIPLLSIYTEDPNFTSYFGRVDRLRNSLTDLVNSQDKDVLLGYDWEVEGEGMASYRLAKSVLTTVKEFDNQHPIYTFGIISKKAPIAFTDAIGTYVSGKWGNTAMELDRLVVLDNLDGVTKPVGFGVFSKGEPRGNSAAGFRAQLYKSIIVGVKGMFYYRDPISSSVTSVLPVLRTELDALLPLIREPHWTSWSASSSDSGIFFGTRDNGKEAFIIALNDTAAPVTTTFTISGLYTYTPVSVKNFFAGAEIVPFADSKFTVTIPANSTAVYRLKRSVS